MPVTTVEITQTFFLTVFFLTYSESYGFFFFFLKVYLISTAVETNSEYPLYFIF